MNIVNFSREISQVVTVCRWAYSGLSGKEISLLASTDSTQSLSSSSVSLHKTLPHCLSVPICNPPTLQSRCVHSHEHLKKIVMFPFVYQGEFVKRAGRLKSSTFSQKNSTNEKTSYHINADSRLKCQSIKTADSVTN